MTARDLYEYALTELNKLEAPSLLLEDFNYFMNKAVQQYINLVYAKLELDQQSTDDIRVLKATTMLAPQKFTNTGEYASTTPAFNTSLFKTSYYVDLPEDYMHLLNCIVEYKVNTSNFKCYNKGESVYFAARRLTSDMYTQILNNAYLRPMYKRPYYYINNINSATNIVTHPGMDDDILSVVSNSAADPADIAALYSAKSALIVAEANYKSNPTNTTYQNAYNTAYTAYHEALDAIAPEGTKVDSQTETGDRLANPSVVRLELRFGNDDTVFTPSMLYIDYLKAPMYIRLTQDQIDATLDTSQVLEFPDYVCFEIVNIFTRLLMENASDPRLQTNMPINQTIFNPAIQQAANSKN